MSLFVTASKAHKSLGEILKKANSLAESFKNPKTKVDSLDDLSCDLKAFYKRCYVALDPVVKMVMQNRGVSVFKNIYVGYDTEYTVDDYRKHLNKIVSYQLALNHKVFLRVPQPFDFVLGEKDPKSGVFRNQDKVTPFEVVLQNSINELCKSYRAEFSKEIDEFNGILTQALEDEGIPHYEKNHFKVFGFKRSENKLHLSYTDDKGMVSSTQLFDKCLELDQELGTCLQWLKDFVTGLGCK